MNLFRLSLILTMLFLMGCTTFGDIHQSEPYKSLFITGKSPDSLANCALFEAKRKGLNASLARKDDAFLLLLSRTYINDIPFAEITFKPQDQGTFIDVRAFSGYGVDKSWAMDCVVACAAPQNSPGNIEGVKQ